MLLKDKKKGFATLIIKRMSGPGEMSPSFYSEMKPKPMVDGAEQDDDAAYRACCDDMMSAIKSGDSQRLKSAMKSFVSMMMDEYDSEKD